MSDSDPLGKRALFSPPAGEAPAQDDDGKTAMFSAGPRRPGTVVLECSRCLTRNRMSVVEAGVRIAYLSAWVPGKRFSRWIQCPECERRTWCKIHWFG